MTKPSAFVSSNNPVFYIAEIGGNHEGSYKNAQELSELAISSGADAIKFQLYKGDTLVSPVISPDRNIHFKKFELNQQQHLSLAQKIIDSGCHYMSSVWDADMLNWINPYIKIHKVGSGDLTCFPFLRLLAQTGKPIILSTGLSTLNEISESVSFIQSVDDSYKTNRKLALLQCTSSYPTPDVDANLSAMQTLRDTFDLPVGYSDHTIGTLAIEVAVAMGAEIIEKHFTNTRENKTFRDHHVSLTSNEIQMLLPRLTRIKDMQGNPEKKPTQTELDSGHVLSFRRSLYAAQDLTSGDIITKSSLTVMRPAHGICASRLDNIIGKHCLRDIKRLDVLRDEDVSD